MMWAMRLHYLVLLIAVSFGSSVPKGLAAESGDPQKGRQLFRACTACHSLAPGRHMTGPSLATTWGRKAGTVEGFVRYSKALKQADVVWDEHAMDAWLANPSAFIPGNRMTFRGLPDQAQRRDLVAFLRSVSEEEGLPEETTGQGRMIDLKALDANNRMTSINRCGDTYTVVVETGEAHAFWEFNLRIKTDGSEIGPEPGHPVIIPASMRGDRAFAIFASPAEISPFITEAC